MSGAMACSATAKNVDDSVVTAQRAALAQNTTGKGFGPQSPRDIDQAYGTNQRVFGFAPNRSQMNLCNIHFHKNAEHKGGDFTTYAGNGDGKGKNTGYVYDGKLSDSQMKPVSGKVCGAKGDPLQSGDTIEVHWVFSAAQVSPGPTLGACLADSTMNPGLRVEGQVFVLANDENALDFNQLAEVAMVNGYAQAPNIPSNTGKPVEYLGSTTGPSFNEQGSPLQVSWSMRPETAVLDINSVEKWCEGNVFNEDHAHGVRNLVVNPALLSTIN
nr:delta-class carbonic anhydrase [Alteromonas flava]